MSKPKINPRTMAQAAKLAGYHCKEVEAMAIDVGKAMMRDQADWIDSVMKDLLPPDLYEAGLKMDRVDEIASYAKAHQIQVIYIPDTLRIRINVHGKAHAEFVPQLTVDGEPVHFVPSPPSQN